MSAPRSLPLSWPHAFSADGSYTLWAKLINMVRVREDFLSAAGHELRTPLTSLKLQLQLLERTRPPDLGAPRALTRELPLQPALLAEHLPPQTAG